MIDRYGPPDAPLVILIHGAVVNRATMAPLAHALALRRRVWVPDLPGHGSRRAERFTLEASLADLERLVGEAGSVPVVIAGDSLGGYVALALAARCGTRLTGVVAGGCTFPMRGIAAVGAKLTDLPVAAFAAVAGEGKVEGALLRAFVAAGGDRETCRQTAAIGLRLTARRESIAALREFDLAGAVGAIRCPIAFVNGGRDIPIAWLAGRYARMAQRGRAITIEAASHGVMTLRPHAVAAEIAALFSGAAPATA